MKKLICVVLFGLFLTGCATSKDDLCKIYQDEDTQKILEQIATGQKTLDEICQ
jgi:hypothetical protein